MLGRAAGGLLGGEEGSVPRLRRPVLPAGAVQGMPEGDREEGQGGLRPGGHQDEDQDRDEGGQGVVIN